MVPPSQARRPLEIETREHGLGFTKNENVLGLYKVCHLGSMETLVVGKRKRLAPDPALETETTHRSIVTVETNPAAEDETVTPHRRNTTVDGGVESLSLRPPEERALTVS